MKKYILALLVLIAAIAPFFIFKNTHTAAQAVREHFFKYLRARKDNLALEEIEKMLAIDPNNLSAIWGKAEVLRRNYKFKESEELLRRVLSQDPNHVPSLISLSYIRYHDDNLRDALKLLKQVLNQPNLDRENKALAFMLMGSVNAKRSERRGLLGKIAYGMQVKNYFEKAKILAPDLSDVHLGLGTFCLFAPRMAGGDLNKAIEELELAVKLTPDFATANARLAQAYKKKGDLAKYNFYLKRAKELDSENEALKEIAKE